MTTWTTSSGRTYSRVGGKTYVTGGAGAVSSAVVAADAAARQQATRIANIARAQQVLAQRALGASGAELTRYQSQQAALGREVTAVQAGTTTQAIQATERQRVAAEEERTWRAKAQAIILKYGKGIGCALHPWACALLYGLYGTKEAAVAAGKAAEGAKDIITDIITPTAAVSVECPEGLFYDATWYQKCKEGYVEYSLKGHNKCVCSAKIAEAKTQLDSLYIKENGNGDGIFAGLEGIGDVTKYIPVLIIGAIVVAAVSMFKK